MLTEGILSSTPLNLQRPRIIRPDSISSLSKLPAGVYLNGHFLSKKLCSTQLARGTFLTFSGHISIGDKKIRNLFAVLPKTFSTTRLPLLSR